MSAPFKRLKLVLKHILGRDLYLRPDRRIQTCYYGSRYGGWALPVGVVVTDSVVYSFGIGEDASFDLALIKATGCEVHGFDPTPKSLSWVARTIREPRFKIHPLALGSSDGNLQLWLPKNPEHVSASCRPSETLSDESFMADCKCLASIMSDLGHERVEVLKMDIEGAEYEVIRTLTESELLDRVGCLLVEFHHWMPSFSREQTLTAIRQLRARGLGIGWVSDTGHELLFIRV